MCDEQDEVPLLYLAPVEDAGAEAQEELEEAAEEVVASAASSPKKGKDEVKDDGNEDGNEKKASPAKKEASTTDTGDKGFGVSFLLGLEVRCKEGGGRMFKKEVEYRDPLPALAPETFCIHCTCVRVRASQDMDIDDFDADAEEATLAALAEACNLDLSSCEVLSVEAGSVNVRAMFVHMEDRSHAEEVKAFMEESAKAGTLLDAEEFGHVTCSDVVIFGPSEEEKEEAAEAEDDFGEPVEEEPVEEEEEVNELWNLLGDFELEDKYDDPA